MQNFNLEKRKFGAFRLIQLLKQSKFLIFFIGIIFFSFYNFSIYPIRNPIIISNMHPKNGIKTAAINDHSRLVIDGDSALAAFPNKTGSGTLEDPFILDSALFPSTGINRSLHLLNTRTYVYVKGANFHQVWDSDNPPTDYEFEHGAYWRASLYLQNVSGVSVIDCKFWENPAHVALNNASQITIIDSSFTNPHTDLDPPYLDQINFFVFDTMMVINQSSEVYIHSNQICNGSIVGLNSDAIEIYNCSFISERILSSIIGLGDCYNSKVDSCIIKEVFHPGWNITYSMAIGVGLEGYNNTIENNTIAYCNVGIGLGNSYNNLIRYNTIVENVRGIEIRPECYNNIIVFNNISYNGYDGILKYNDNNIIANNTMIGNGFMIIPTTVIDGYFIRLAPSHMYLILILGSAIVLSRVLRKKSKTFNKEP